MAINPFGIAEQQAEQKLVQDAQKPQFQPTLTKQQTQQLAKRYKENPKAFTPQVVSQLENNAAYHQVAFYPGDFNFSEAIMQFGKGFASGFTTLEAGDHPDNEYENIARSLGHLVGFAPGIMSAPLKAVGLVNAARAIGKVKSVPLFLSSKLTKKVGDVVGPAVKTAARGRQGAMAEAAKFLSKGPIKHVSEGAFNLGIASGISAWQGGVDAIMQSTFSGAIFGGVFRTLGNVVKTGDKASDKIIRGMAGSVFQGLPSTIRGATSAEQVYEYLLGAYFGAGERPWYKQGSMQFMKEMNKEIPKNAELEYTMDPSLMGKKYRNLEPEIQEQVQKDIRKIYDPENARARGFFLLQELRKRGIDLTKQITPEGEITQEGYKFLAKTNKEGLDKAFQDSKLKVPEPELTPEGVAVRPAEQRIAAKVSELESGIAERQTLIKQLETSLKKELKKTPEEQNAINITFAKDKIAETTKEIDTRILEKEKLTKAVEGISEKIDLIIEDSANDDVGLVGSDGSKSIVGHRALQFTEINLRNIWDKPDFNAEIKTDLKTLTANELNSILVKEIKRGKTPNTTKIIDKIAKKFKIVKTDEMEGGLRQWMTRLNKGHNQKFLRVYFQESQFDKETGGLIKLANAKVEEFDSRAPYTVGGKRKEVIEPLKVIEEVFINEGGKTGQKEIGALVTLDTVTIKDKEGVLVDKTLGDLRKDAQFNRSNSYEEAVSNIQAQMAKKKLYMFGGRGDADKLFFVKFHPKINKLSKNVTDYLNKNVFNTKSYKEAEAAFVNRAKRDMKATEARLLHKKAVKSNILYDLGMNGLTINRKNLNEIWTNKDGFLNNALAYNKRLQILFTPAWAGSREYAKETFGKKGTSPDKDFIKAGDKFRYIVIPDLKDLPKDLHSEKLLDFDARLYKEHVDGSIIARTDVINYNNKDAGMPKSGQNKAFIVSPEISNNKELGALYGKFMFHDAGKNLSEAMKKAGLHYIIHESSAKQMGLRDYNNYSIKRTKIALENDNIYSLDPRHIKYNYSVKQSDMMFRHNARIPKQWFGHLNSRITVAPVSVEVIKDIYNETIYKTYKGQDKYNDLLTSYMESPTAKKEAELIKNIDKIGINNLLDVINSSEGTRFADAAYQKLLKINKEIAYENAKEQGIKAEELNEYVKEIEDFNTMTDRLIVQASKLPKGKTGVSPIFSHKWIRPYRIQVMKNYIMAQITKPQIENSAAARMRPYDLGLQANFDNVNPRLKELQKKDDIFFLDDNYKKMPIKTYLNVKERTLEDFYNALQEGRYKGFEAEAKEVLRSIVVRVPMDSISGSHALEFAGFTGRQGHGILIHPRVMRALGGADLDGDEAFIYFGGKNSAGDGFGMKKTWKDAYAANKNEYVQYVSLKRKANGQYEYKTKAEYDKLSDAQKKTFAEYIPDNKLGAVRRPDGKFGNMTMEDLLTLGQTDYSKKLATDKVWMYSPDVRRQISENVVDGRQLLGGVATMTQTMKAAHDVMSNTENKINTFRFRVPFGKQEGEYEVRIEARQEKDWLDYARRLSSSMVAFTSDPMDVGGIKSYNFLWKQLHDAYFKIKDVRRVELLEDVNKKTGEVTEREVKSIAKEFKDNDAFYARFRPSPKAPIEAASARLRGGLVKQFSDLNNAIFGKNYQTGRTWKEDEIRDKLSFLRDYPGQLTNMLAKQGNLVTETGRWSDNILNKLDIIKLNQLYKETNDLAKQFKMEMQDDKAQWIETVMGRGTFKIHQMKFVGKVMNPEFEAWIEGHRRDKDTGKYTGKDAIATDGFGNEPGLFKRFVDGLAYTPIEYEQKYRTRSAVKSTKAGKQKISYARSKFQSDVKNDKLTNNQKKRIVNEITEMAEDFILTNDLHDMISLRMLSKHIKKHRDLLTDDKIKEIHTEVQRIKDDSYLSKRNRFNPAEFYEKNEYLNESVRRGIERLEEYQKETGAKPVESERSAKMDQIEVDKSIRAFKKTLSTRQEKELFDILMLGSYNRATKDKAEFVKALTKERVPIDRATTMWYMTSGARTSMTKLGFASEAIPDIMIRRFLSEYANLTEKVVKIKEPDVKKIVEVAKDLDKNKITYDNKEVDFIENKTPKNIKDSYVGDMETYEGLVEGKLPKDQKKVIMDLAENLHYMTNGSAINLNQIAAGIVGKPLNEMSKNDYIILNNFLKDIRKGSIWQRIFNEKDPDMRARYWMLFPRAVNKEMMKYDILWLKKEGYFKSKGKEVFGTIRKPTWWLEGIQDWISRTSEKAMDVGDALKLETATKLSFYVDNVSNGEVLRRFAVRKMERELQHRVRTESTSLKSKEQKELLARDYENLYQEMAKDKDVQAALAKKYNIINPQGKRETLEGNKIVDKIIDVYAEMNQKIFGIIQGKQSIIDKYTLKDEKGNLKFFDDARKEPQMDWQKFINDTTEAYKTGKDITTDFGIDGLRQIGRSMNLSFVKQRLELFGNKLKEISKTKVKDRTKEDKQFVKNFNTQRKEIEKLISKLQNTRITKTGQYDFRTYFPHMFHSKTEAMKSVERQMKAIEKSDMSEADKNVERNKLLYRMKTLTGDFQDINGEYWEAYDKAAEVALSNQYKKGDKINWVDLDMSSPNMMKRSTHLPGWSIEHQAYEIYANNIAQTYFNQMNQVFTRAMIGQFADRARVKGWDKVKYNDKSNLSLLQKWENYLKLYAQDAMGNPSIIPDYIYDNPGMKVSATPYGWWADNRMKNLLGNIKEGLRINESEYPNINKFLEKASYSELKGISNLEAKFELASLLAHPKSVTGNVFGGSIHTIQSASYQNWRAGMDMKELRRINPEWKTKDDINRFIIKHGVVPDFMISEWGLNPQVRKMGKQEFMKDVVKNMQEGKINRKIFNELMDKHQLSKSMMDVAAQFMSRPEMMLRRHSFMAHYVEAWKRFDGAIENVDHPFLIEQAKKGVQATQFLYSAPFRPAFARTQLGKILTRFQLWQWNAARFRNDIAREARIFGIQEGTPAYEKFKRTLQIDMFVFAMANIFAYSLFDTALPAPWSWLQDSSEWLFGDEKERERTFMGTYPAAIAPLQLVTPPIARLPVAGLDAFISNDWQRFTNYHIYTMAPFGRILKDFSPYAKNNLLENPMGVIDKFTGIPMYGISRMRKEIVRDGVYKP